MTFDRRIHPARRWALSIHHNGVGRPFESWRSELERRDDPSDIRIALMAGAGLVEGGLRNGPAPMMPAALSNWARLLRDTADPQNGHPDAGAMKAPRSIRAARRIVAALRRPQLRLQAPVSN